MVVLDASALIAYLDGEDAHHAVAEELLAQAIEDDLAASSLTLAEVLVVPVWDGRLDPVRAVLRDLEVQELQFPGDTVVRLAQLRATTGLAARRPSQVRRSIDQVPADRLDGTRSYR
ncbi:MAG: type II toxin-antitoxin system VapC family toxin [Nocardioides sp.]